MAEQKIGRRLRKIEQVHHLNHDRQDNRPENLEVVASIAHHRLKHRKPTSVLRGAGEFNPIIECACGCGERFNKFDSSDRPRKFVAGHNTNKDPKEIENQFLNALGSNWFNLNELSLISNETVHSLSKASIRLREKGLIILFKRRFFHKDFAPEQYINPYVECGCGCQRKLKKFDNLLRVRNFISGHNLRRMVNV